MARGRSARACAPGGFSPSWPGCRPPVRTLVSKEQRALYAQHAPDGLELDDLSILGPILVLKVTFAPEGYGRRLVAELWLMRTTP